MSYREELLPHAAYSIPITSYEGQRHIQTNDPLPLMGSESIVDDSSLKRVLTPKGYKHTFADIDEPAQKRYTDFRRRDLSTSPSARSRRLSETVSMQNNPEQEVKRHGIFYKLRKVLEWLSIG